MEEFSRFGKKKVQTNGVYPMKDKEWKIPKVPRDSEGFVKAFEADDTEGIASFYDEFGFVVVKNILSQDEVIFWN